MHQNALKCFRIKRYTYTLAESGLLRGPRFCLHVTIKHLDIALQPASRL